MEYAIQLKNVTKTFGKVVANKNVNLDVKKGEILSLLGENGSAVVEDWDLSGKIVKAFSEEEKEIVPVRTAAGLTKTMAPRREDTIRVEELPRVPGDIADFHRNVAAVLLRGEEPAVKLPEVKRVMRLMETVFESAEKNHVMDFE